MCGGGGDGRLDTQIKLYGNLITHKSQFRIYNTYAYNIKHGLPSVISHCKYLF